MDTRTMIREFNVAFGRPVNNSLTSLTVSERELLGKLLLEETLEYCTKGLGLKVFDNTNGTVVAARGLYPDSDTCLNLQLDEGQFVDPIECADGLADVNVVIHFAAHWQGINLDKATQIVNDSNMSKLGPNGKAIINGVTSGYQQFDEAESGSINCEAGFDPSKPIGKILKGPNFYEPRNELQFLLMQENANE